MRDEGTEPFAHLPVGIAFVGSAVQVQVEILPHVGTEWGDLLGFDSQRFPL